MSRENSKAAKVKRSKERGGEESSKKSLIVKSKREFEKGRAQKPEIWGIEFCVKRLECGQQFHSFEIWLKFP